MFTTLYYLYSGKQIFIDHIIRDDLRFETIIIDEAAQATEPSTLIPLRYGCRRLVLVGDPRQLPATVLSPTAQKAGLGVSLFERLENAGHPVVLLFVQYRMHPSIRLFPSQHFYQSRLVDHPSVLHIRNLSTSLLHTANNANLLSGIVSTNNLQQVISSNALFQPVAFFDLPSRELSEGTSFRNDDEAELVLAILQALWNLWLETSSLTSSSTSLGTDSVSKCDKSRCNHNLNHPSALSIGIISSYKAQVNSIKNRLIDIIPDSALSSLPDQPFFSRRQIEVNTVDGFQGKEKDIIIFSCVRTSTHGIGFLADERRINVAITRAKQQLIIVGRAQALWEGSDTWRALISSLQNRNFIHKVHA